MDPPSHARKVSKMPTVLMILAVQQSGLQARPPLGTAHLIFPTTLLKRDTYLHFYTRGLSLREGGAWPALLRDQAKLGFFGSKPVIFNYIAYEPPQRTDLPAH